METPFLFVFNHTICSLQLGQIGDDSDATWNASSRGVYRYVEVKGHCMLLSQRSDMPQLQEEGTHPVLCRTRQLSSVRTHLHVCKHKTFVAFFSTYKTYAFKGRSCMFCTYSRKSASSRKSFVGDTTKAILQLGHITALA